MRLIILDDSLPTKEANCQSYFRMTVYDKAKFIIRIPFWQEGRKDLFFTWRDSLHRRALECHRIHNRQKIE